MDFRALHGIEDDAHAIRNIDGHAAWFYKAREVRLRRDLYQKTLASNASVGRQKALRRKGTILEGKRFADLMRHWREVWTAAERTAIERVFNYTTVAAKADGLFVSV